MAAGYSKTPLWKKLGVSAGADLLLIDPPDDWTIPDLPDGVSVRSSATTNAAAGEARQDRAAGVVIAFFRALADLREGVPELAPLIFPAGALWVAWPRRAGGQESDIREQDIRDVALPVGLVDVKVAALQEHWSGLRLVWRRERRATSRPTPG